MKLTPPKVPIIYLLISFIFIGMSCNFKQNLTQFEATIEDKYIVEFTNKAGKWKALDFILVESDKVYGILLDKQNTENNLIDRFEVGKKYLFFIDRNNLTTIEGHNLGIELIKLDGQIIYKKD